VSNVVLVSDMLRGFMEEGHALYCGPEARKIIPCVQELLKRELAQGSHIIHLADAHDPDDLEFQMFPPHCVRGTVECEIIPELAQFPAEIMHKRRYSGFFETELEERLKELRPDKIIVVGVCTHICVLFVTAEARLRDYPVEVPRDCVASFDPQWHEIGLKYMQEVTGAKLV